MCQCNNTCNKEKELKQQQDKARDKRYFVERVLLMRCQTRPDSFDLISCAEAASMAWNWLERNVPEPPR